MGSQDAYPASDQGAVQWHPRWRRHSPSQFERPVDEIREIRALWNAGQYPGLLEFVRSMEDLIKAAAEEGNPIVFT